MKKLALLILVFYWNHASCQWFRCSTGFVSTNQAISLPSSKHAGAKVFLLQKYQAPTLTVCLEDCCSGKYGSCSVAEYKNRSAENNCLYYSCQPILKCKFMDSEGTDTFTFPLTSSQNFNVHQREGADRGNENTLTESASTLQPQGSNFKDHTRAVSARKGVQPLPTAPVEDSLVTPKEVSVTHFRNDDFSTASGTNHARTVSARKGVEFGVNTGDNKSSSQGMSLEHDSFSKSSDVVALNDFLHEDELSFKNDNTTIKPRKGVDLETESGKIKARKGVEVLNSSASTDAPKTIKSKVKPRKGVALFLATAVVNKTAFSEPVLKLKSADSTPHTDRRNFAQTSPSDFSVSPNLISMLEQVFRDESTFSGVSSEFGHQTPTHDPSASNSFTITPTPVSSTKHGEYTTLPPNSASLNLRSSTPIAPKSSFLPYHSILPSKSLGHHEKIVESTPPLAAVTKPIKLLSTSLSRLTGGYLSPSHTPVLQTSMNAKYGMSDDQSAVHHRKEVLLITVSSPNKTKLSVQSNTDDLENERRYKSSMHLVLSLVFGLLVLFVVFGAVAKRVYDVWMRRHYHRMDFLIDGMYDGFS